MQLDIWLKENRYTQREFAEQIGMSEIVLSKIMNCSRNIKLIEAIRISEFTKNKVKPIDWIAFMGKE